MRGSNKKSKSRQLFEEVFEQQTRRFSAFDLLGLSSELQDAPDPEKKKSRRDSQSEGLAKSELESIDINLPSHSPDSHTQAHQRNDKTSLFDESHNLGHTHILGNDSLTHTSVPSIGDNESLRGESKSHKEISRSVSSFQFPHPQAQVYRNDPHSLVLGPDSISEEPTQGTLAKDDLPRDDGSFLVEFSAVALLPTAKVDEIANEGLTSKSSLSQSQLADRKAPPVWSSLEIASDTESKGIEKSSLEKKSDGLALEQTVDGLSALGPDRESIGMTVRPHLGLTQAENNLSNLGSDGHTAAQVSSSVHTSILLAPVQWKVWQVLQSLEATDAVTSYRQIAKMITSSSIDGVRKAIRVIEREGGIIAKETVRSAQIQGFRFKLNKSISFYKGSVNQAKAILKRGLRLDQTPDRKSLMLGPDRLRMFVCKNINIKQTDIVRLLNVTPHSWAIREHTLIQIAELLPDMTAIEFRLSLTHLVEQARLAKQPVRNHNAWIKAAFEKSGGPLVTERDIEARFSRNDTRKPSEASVPATATTSEKVNYEDKLLRLYLTCTEKDRLEIDKIAQQRAAPLLHVVADEHRTSVLEEARVEAIKAFFEGK